MRHRRAQRDSGGLIIYISDNLRTVVDDVCLKTVDDCIIWLKLKGTVFGLQNDLFLCLCYNIPSGSSREAFVNDSIFDMILDDMFAFEDKYGQCNFLVTGDFNARTGNRFDFVEDEFLHKLDMLPDDYVEDVFLNRVSEDTTVNEYGNYLLDFCKTSGLRIMNGRIGSDGGVGKFTCVTQNGSSVVDYILCRPDLMKFFTAFAVHEPNISSDHCELRFTIGSSKTRTDEACAKDFGHLEYTYKWDTNEKERFIQDMKSDVIQDRLKGITDELYFAENESDIDLNLNNFYGIIDDVCTPVFKKRLKNNTSHTQTHAKKQSWFDSECEAQQNQFYKTLRDYRREKSELNRQNMVKNRSAYKTLIRSKRFQYDKNQTKRLEEARVKNAKEYWKLLKGLSTKKASRLNVSHFEEYFRAINNPDSVFFQPDDDAIDFNERYLNGELQIMFDELNDEISCAEIFKACRELDIGKSGGPDFVLNEFFKYGVHEMISYLHKLFNVVFEKGYFPSKWTEGFIVPLHKKGDVNLVENYRGITLLSTLGKLFSRILNNRLVEWAEEYSVYVEAQAGFRKHMGTVDNVFVLHGLITHLLNENKKLYAAFIDFTKAFDYVVRENMWSKLLKVGIRGKHSVYPSVCRTDGYGTDRRLQEHALFRAKNVLYSFSSKTVRFECIVISALHVHLLSSKTP